MHDAEELITHAGFLRRLALGLLRGDAAAADDVVQQTYLASLGSRTVPPRDARAWLARVARNVAFRIHRTETRRRRRELAVALRRTEEPAAVDAVARLEVQRRVVEAVGALEEPYRSTVVLRYLDGLAPGEIARRLGVPKETVRTRLTRALRALRARLDNEWEGGRNEWALALLPLTMPTRAAAAGTALSGGLAMTSKTKVALILLPVCAGFAGALGHAAWAERAAPARANSDVSGLIARVASLEAERDSLRETAGLLRREIESLHQELREARAAGTTSTQDELAHGGDLSSIDWRRYLPALRSMAARDPESTKREDPALASARNELIEEVAARLDDLPDRFAVDDLWRIPEVGGHIAAALAADLDAGLQPDAIEAIRDGVDAALRRAESDLPDPALDIERFAAAEQAAAAAEEVVALHADPDLARRAADVLGPLWRRDFWRVVRLGTLTEKAFADFVAEMPAEVDAQTLTRVREASARMFKSFVELRARLARQLGESMVRAFLLEPGHGGADEAVLDQQRRRDDYPTIARQLRAAFAAHQARFEREYYTLLPAAAQEQQRLVAATLFLFDSAE